MKFFNNAPNAPSLDFRGITVIGLDFPPPFTPADSAPTSPNAMDDEFDAGSLDGKWTLRNSPGTPLFTPESFVYIPVNTGGGFGLWRGMSQPLPAENCTFEAKFDIEKNYTTGDFFGGIGFLDNNGTGTVASYGSNGSGVLVARADNVNLYGPNGNVLPDINCGLPAFHYVKIQYILASNAFNYWISGNGFAWKLCKTLQAVSGATATRVFIGARNNAVINPLGVWFDYFRRTA